MIINYNDQFTCEESPVIKASPNFTKLNVRCERREKDEGALAQKEEAEPPSARLLAGGVAF
jgi:hypothetical protein